ncbi:MAG: hypothetical protein EOO61_22780 [Hymenobacter sp.]|nr:MAG: hypothetical protein EOO61_22780 [Hymenobacter sp.]
MANINAVAPDLANLQGIYFDKKLQRQQGTSLQFTCTQPVTLLVGFFKDKNTIYLQEPQLETDASANDYGQAEIKIANGLIVSGMPPVNVHAYTFKAGTHNFTLGKGLAVLLGFTNGNQPLKSRDAGLTSERRGELDWLFE